MKAPDPLIVPWRGQQLRVRHDDPHLTPYSPKGATIRSAIELASDVEGLRLVLMATVTGSATTAASSVAAARAATKREARPSRDGPLSG